MQKFVNVERGPLTFTWSLLTRPGGVAREESGEGHEIAGHWEEVGPGSSERRFVPGGSSERRWLGSSALLGRGGSEVYMMGASERMFRGASERMFKGASERMFRGASERRFVGGSERRLGGASERLAPGHLGSSQNMPVAPASASSSEDASSGGVWPSSLTLGPERQS